MLKKFRKLGKVEKGRKKKYFYGKKIGMALCEK